jgi:hypothetical protein
MSNKCICSISTGSVNESCPGLSGRVRTLYGFSLRVVSLLSSRLTAGALVRFFDFLKYVV